MKYESILNLTLPKIGFGTRKIGGGSSADPKTDPVSTAALHSAVEIGYTHFDTAEMYANGHSEELLGQAIRESNTPREPLFILIAHYTGAAYAQTLPKTEAEKRINKAHFATGLEGSPLHFSMEPK